MMLVSYEVFALTCQPSNKNCDFYRCQETKRSCGKNGYWNKFAVPYCEIFVQKEKQFSKNTQRFFKNVRYCLQAQLIEKTHSVACRDIKDYAFHTHVSCYINSGFCYLNDKEKTALLKELKASFVYPSTWKEAFAVQLGCFNKLNYQEKLWAN